MEKFDASIVFIFIPKLLNILIADESRLGFVFSVSHKIITLLSNKSFFAALKVERNVMFIILTLIIIVAAFNIISGLTILVKNLD